MKNIYFYFVFIIVAFCGCNVVSFTEENDFFGVAKNKDYLYSQGLELSSNSKTENTPALIKDIAGYIPSLNPLGKVEPSRYTYSAGQKMFTPDNIRTTEIQPNDNPYTGLLYAQLGKEEITEESWKWANLMIGTTGPNSYADRTQRWFHGLFDMQKPNGWDYQVDNEAVFMHQSGLEVRDVQLKYNNYKFDQTSGYNLNLGTWNTSAELFVDWRTGLNYELFSKAIQHDYAFHFYNKPYIRGVVRDMTLDGNTFHTSDVTVDKEPFIYGNRFGFKFEFYGYELDIFNVTQSKIYDEQKLPIHTYGGWMVTKKFEF